MQFPGRIEQLGDGRWRAWSSGSSAGEVEVTAGDQDEAIAKLKREIRYRIELCPCTGVDDEFVELEIERGG